MRLALASVVLLPVAPVACATADVPRTEHPAPYVQHSTSAVPDTSQRSRLVEAATSPPAPTELTRVAGLPTLLERWQGVPRLSRALQATAWQEVAVIQMALNAAAASGLVVDGHFGPATEAAVRVFQSSAGITVDGIVGPEALGALIEALSDAGGAVPPPPVYEWATARPTASPSPAVPYYGFTSGTVCADGWISQSTGQGTCSWHGGIR